MKAARDLFADKKLEAYAAKAQLEKLQEEKKEGTEIAVAEWNSKHDKKKLEKRADRAEKYADGCIALALYYAKEAEVAILEAVAAREDAFKC